MRYVWLGLVVAACGSHPKPVEVDGAGDPGDGGATVDTSGDPDAVGTADAPPPDAPSIDAFPAVLDVGINCRNDCVLVASPASIAVAAGTEFEVNWINTGDTECDVAKVDQFNQVPIIIGLQPGTSHHDAVRQWCGSFTGTFDFRITICTIHSYIPVDCSVP
jgi:hypothetical protein